MKKINKKVLALILLILGVFVTLCAGIVYWFYQKFVNEAPLAGVVVMDPELTPPQTPTPTSEPQMLSGDVIY
jgi:flagellar basal body-associated protein FliL